MVNQILKPGVSCTFSQYFELPFTIDDILAELGCQIERRPIDLPRQPLQDSLDQLSQELRRNLKRIELVNEMARREALIGPILFEVAERTDRRINVEYAIVVNEHLRGTVDYYIAGHNLIVVEAKQADLVRGFTQLAVELIALDQWTKSEVPLLYGAVTTGEDWRFGCFDRQRRVIQQDDKRYLIPEKLAALMEVLIGILKDS
ncbi:MAG: hypothetical protein MUF49_06840 [Oculatellaceae cyanobacterium Prado106]|jgi:hypothetical protein|nr:hypothetical protein [Oculatellaceae cyanobacterium Prado106]